MTLDNREHKSINTEDLIRTAGIASKNITSLNLMEKLNNKYLEQQFALNLHYHMPVSSWAQWKLIFLILRKMHLCYGTTILMKHSLFEHMAKKNLSPS